MTYRIGEIVPMRAIIALREASKRIHETDEGAAGGALHIILDDDNVSDHNLDWCERQAREEMAESGPELYAEYMICLTLLRLFPDEDSRLAALGEYEDRAD